MSPELVDQKFNDQNIFVIIGKLEATVVNLTEKFDGIYKTLQEIRETLSQSTKLSYEHQFRLDAQQKEIDGLKTWRESFLESIKEEKKGQKNWWNSVTSKTISVVLAAIIISVAAFHYENLKHELSNAKNIISADLK